MLDFTPKADPVTGGTAVAKLITIDPPLKPLEAGETSTSTVKVFFDIIKTGSYNFEATDPSTINGITTGLSVQPMKGTFDTIETDKSLDFTISGMPKTSLEGNSLAVSKAVTLNTGAIQFDSTPIEGNIPLGPNALCSPTDKTTVAPILSLKTGRIWMDRNLGASRVAESATDYWAFGCMFQWGRGNDGAASMNWTSANAGRFTNGFAAYNILSSGDTPGNQFIPTPDSSSDWRSSPNTALWQGVNGTNNPCPNRYRLPTKAEFGSEIDGYAMKNIADAYTRLKIPSSHYYVPSGTLVINNFSDASYWTSTYPPKNQPSNIYFFFSGIELNTRSPNWGFSIRCIKN